MNLINYFFAPFCQLKVFVLNDFVIRRFTRRYQPRSRSLSTSVNKHSELNKIKSSPNFRKEKNREFRSYLSVEELH